MFDTIDIDPDWGGDTDLMTVDDPDYTTVDDSDYVTVDAEDLMSLRGGRAPSVEEILGFAFDDAVGFQTMANLEAARQVFAVHDAFQIAREYPRIYLPVSAASKSPGVDAIDFAERSVAFDLAQRLHLSENVVRDYDHQAAVLRETLPQLCELFRSGRISQQHVRAAVDNATGFPTPEVAATYDQRLATIVEGLRPGEFARRCRLVRERLCVDTLQERHHTARMKRRVSIEADEDGMGWLNLYAPMTDLAVIDARLSGTATRMRQEPGEERTKEQLRADALIAWAKGDSNSPAATTTVEPILLVDADGRFAELLGYGPIDPHTAATTLRNAPSFHRVVNDPVAPANLSLDRRSYRPSADQRRWLTLRYGLDDDATPFLAPDAEIDHVIEYQHGGLTNVTNLLPLKKRLHRLKSVTKIRIDPDPGGGIRVRTPTTHHTDPPPF
ncbi:hypothetical protein GCM10027568_16670 [Humibacter soli]